MVASVQSLENDSLSKRRLCVKTYMGKTWPCQRLSVDLHNMALSSIKLSCLHSTAYFALIYVKALFFAQKEREKIKTASRWFVSYAVSHVFKNNLEVQLATADIAHEILNKRLNNEEIEALEQLDFKVDFASYERLLKLFETIAYKYLKHGWFDEWRDNIQYLRDVMEAKLQKPPKPPKFGCWRRMIKKLFTWRSAKPKRTPIHRQPNFPYPSDGIEMI